MAESAEEREERIQSYIAAAKFGNKTARAALGWECIREEQNRAGLKKALRHFVRLKAMDRNFALVQIAWAKEIVGDASYAKELEEAVAAGYGPALYLKATIGWTKGERTEPLALFLQAAKAGHLPSTVIWLRKQPRPIWRRIWGLPLLIVAGFKSITIYMENPDDERVLPFVPSGVRN